MDERLNTVEYFVHHEDVRRGADGWQPREIGAGLADDAVAAARGPPGSSSARRRSGSRLVRDDLVQPARASQHVRITAKARTPMVTVTGGPAELTLWALGRTTAAQVRLDGSRA